MVITDSNKTGGRNATRHIWQREAISSNQDVETASSLVLVDLHIFFLEHRSVRYINKSCFA